MTKAVLVDLTRCIGCRGCQVACKEWNERKARKTTMHGSYTNPVSLSSDCYTHIRFYEGEKNGAPAWTFVKEQCRHCEKPACASACPVGALKKTKAGPVIYNYDRCIGCRYCMLACPFHIPKYEWESTRPWVQKCTFCSERIAEGLKPACVQVCPTTTMHYGERNEVLAEARRRIEEDSDRYTKHIYGEKEVGGTSWIYLSSVPLDSIGLDTRLTTTPLPDLTWKYIAKIPAVAGAVVIGGAVSWAITRRNNAGKGE